MKGCGIRLARILKKTGLTCREYIVLKITETETIETYAQIDYKKVET
ncbi:hypothetical protein [Peptoclostridium litorale]|nr:hypothetical protein [Peptoclostridium litorale]